MKKYFLLFTVLVLSLISCSNKSEVKFIGKSLKTPCETFNKHLEDNGFKKDDVGYKGDFLGKEVSVSPMGIVNGHYKELMLTAIFTDSGSDAKQYYKSLCNKIESEHSGFKKENDDSYDFCKTSFYGENGSMITISYTQESNSTITLGVVLAIYKTELELEK